MLRALRRSLGVPAGLLVVFLTMGVALPAALHGEANDDACEAFSGAPDSNSSVRAASPVDSGQHCGICHWLRSLRVFQTDVAQPLPRLLPSASVATDAGCNARRLAIHPVPARAPPA